MACTNSAADANAIQAAKDKLNAVTGTSKKVGGTIIAGVPPSMVKMPLPNYKSQPVETKGSYTAAIEASVDDLRDIENELSSGGSQILTYTHDLQVTVGGHYVTAEDVPNANYGCGKPVMAKVVVSNERTNFQHKDTPDIQSVEQPIPFGTYQIVAANKFNVIAGTNGISMHTDGHVNINSGGRTNITSLYEMNISSANGNLNVLCGHHVQLQGDTVCIQTNDTNNQVVVNSNLGVTKNAVVHGSAYVDGNLYTHHIHAPAVTRETQEVPAQGMMPSNTIIGYVDLSTLLGALGKFIRLPISLFPVRTFSNDVPTKVLGEPMPQKNNDPSKFVTVLKHKHSYYTINSTLHMGNGDVRDIAAGEVNSGAPGVAKEVIHGGYGVA